MEKTSVIIPNFNYSPFLERRINSVVNQTVKPGEIIFLDDCSTDDSLRVAEGLLSQCGVPWRIIKNDCNLGVSRQWLKGIELANCDHVWICEADDYCDLNFLGTILPAFNDDDVVLAYCQSNFVDQSGEVICNYYNYISRYFDFARWSENYKENGIEEINKYLCCINTIPNASAVVFNKSRVDLAKITQISDYANNGDWLFYILCLSSYPENKICYFHAPLNYFVRHQSSVFGSESFSTRPIVEFLTIMMYLLDNFAINQETKEVMLRSLIGNLVYWPVDQKLNVLLSKIMQHLPRENFYLLYSQETEQIISRLKHKIATSEKRIQEQNYDLDNLKKTIEDYNNCWCVNRMKLKTKLLSPLLTRFKKMFVTGLQRKTK